MNKSTILKEINPTDIFLRFLGLDKIPKSNISSPFSEDKKPSFSIFEKENDLRYKCNSTGKYGDCFQLVADIKELDFNATLKCISEEFNIEEDSPKFTFKTRPLNDYHLNYFNQGNWNVSIETLNRYEVTGLDSWEYLKKETGELKKVNLNSGLAGFVYSINNNIEIYVPSQANWTNKFFRNHQKKEDIFGFNQLRKKSKRLIICAGKKDCLILNANGFDAVCFRSENHFVTDTQVNKLKTISKNIYVLYDNDKAGRDAAIKLSNKYKTPVLKLDDEFNDVADFFLKRKANDLDQIINRVNEKIEQKKNNNPGLTVFHEVEFYLNKKYEFRFNKIALDIEYTKKDFDSWSPLKIENIYVELKKLDLKISMQDLQCILRSDFTPEYDPLCDYMNNLPEWDGKTDYISIFANYVQAVDQDRFNYHFKKWCVRVVKCAMEDHYFNKQAFILSDNAKGQNIGKSSWCRYLMPEILSNYIAEDFSSNDKDSRILLCKNMLINLDELAHLNKKEVNSLKSMFSKSQINERLPYDRKNSVLSRRSSFIGSTNQITFLNDETGSVRWLCFIVQSISWKYTKEFNIDQLWTQAYSLLRNGFKHDLTTEDIAENEIQNKRFQILSTEQELISKHFSPSPKGSGRFKTATDILTHLTPLGVKLNNVHVGRALTSLKYERVKYNGIYGFWVTENLVTE